MSQFEKIQEFLNICQLSRIVAQQTTFQAALEQPNYLRNRYRDVLANDNTRVRLGVQSMGSDYINANFISGFENSFTTYIACQAPLVSYFADFWRMIWEQSVPIIVMLTKLVEKSQVKANQYWPNPGHTEYFGPFSVKTHSIAIYKSIIIRKFLLTFEEQTREIVQLHFEEWSDMGVPESSNGILTLIEVAHKFLKKCGQRGGMYLPMVVHCSAGIGRTGTFIGLDIAIQQYQNQLSASVDKIVLRMREQRFGMVQTQEQYLFIYKALEEWLSKQSQSIQSSQSALSIPRSSCASISLSQSSSISSSSSSITPLFVGDKK